MILPYIINAALILGACLAFYKILLRRETFYKVNRYMLMVCLVIAFALPLLPVPQQFSLRKSGELSVVNSEWAANQQQASGPLQTPNYRDETKQPITAKPAVKPGSEETNSKGVSIHNSPPDSYRVTIHFT